VKKPIIFYIDTAAPEPLRTALQQGVAWWNDAFSAAGYIDAFQAKILPPMWIRRMRAIPSSTGMIA
jgi:dihydropteroate synthase